jgi:hypothetical protein
MGNRAAALAEQFEQAIADLSKAVEAYPDDHWHEVHGDEGWTVAATAHHVGFQWPLEKEYIVAAAEGAAPPAYSWDDINARNARHAEDFKACSKADVLGLLQKGSAEMAAYVRGLSDEQLDGKAPLALAGGAEVSAQQLIEGGVLIDHVRSHTKSLLGTVV